MALRKISFAAILTSLVLVLAWTVFRWTRTPAATEPDPVATERGLDYDKEGVSARVVDLWVTGVQSNPTTPWILALRTDRLGLVSAERNEVLAQGKELFTREWITGDRRSHAGDGLGPVYNAQSCAACHRLGLKQAYLQRFSRRGRAPKPGRTFHGQPVRAAM